MTFDAKGSGTFQIVLQRMTPAAPQKLVLFASIGDNANAHAVKVLPAGTWAGQLVSQSILSAPTVANPTTSETTNFSIKAAFGQPGAATGPAKGDGGKYLSLANGRNCAAGSLTATWKAKAGKGKNRKVKKATFYVNDVKVKSVKKPKKGQVTTLTGLASADNLTVEARIKLVRKGADDVTVERSYVIC